MPQYEYECVEDGEVLTLLRPMGRADEPVEDPTGGNRSFVRRHSVFGVGRTSGAPDPPAAAPGCCPCGLAAGSCRDR